MARSKYYGRARPFGSSAARKIQRAFRKRSKKNTLRKRVARLESSQEKKYIDHELSEIVTSDLVSPANILNNFIQPLIVQNVRGDLNNNQRVGDSIMLTSIEVNYIASAQAISASGAGSTTIFQNVRCMLVEDREPTTRIPQPLAPPPTANDPQFATNVCSWDHLLQNPTDNDNTPVQMLAFRNFDVLKSRRFVVHYDKTHALIPGTNRGQTSKISFMKGFKGGKKIVFGPGTSATTTPVYVPDVNGGTAPINSQFYWALLSDKPTLDAPIVYSSIRLRYTDA